MSHEGMMCEISSHFFLFVCFLNVIVEQNILKGIYKFGELEEEPTRVTW